MSWRIDMNSTIRPSTIIGGADSVRVLPQRVAAACAEGSRFFVITDANVQAAWGSEMVSIFDGAIASDDVLVMPAGETTKSVASAEACWGWLASKGARRQDIVVALGGGVVGDLAGFVASTHVRGMKLWQLPTSLLAQVDSSVGGKTGVNLRAGKNLVGSFYQPDLAVLETEFLRTLPDLEFVNGLGEVVKYALLDTGGMLEFLESESGKVRSGDRSVMEPLIERCVMYKVMVVEEDERDRGPRAVLNLGHTTAHALEVTEGYGELSHGRAVAMGLLVALAVSETMFGLPATVRERTMGLFAALDLPTRMHLAPVDVLMTAAARDKKVAAGTTGFVCLRAVGRPVWNVDVPPDVLRASLEVIRS